VGADQCGVPGCDWRFNTNAYSNSASYPDAHPTPNAHTNSTSNSYAYSYSYSYSNAHSHSDSNSFSVPDATNCVTL
jgi:hypothetical protein